MIAHHRVRLMAIAIGASCLGGCSRLATVKNVEPARPGAAFAQSQFPTEREERASPDQSLSRELDVAAEAWRRLQTNPNDAASLQAYNYEIDRIVSLVQTTGKLPAAGFTTIGSGANTHRLTFTSDLKAFSDPRQCNFVPADELAISGAYYAQRVRRFGIGAPVLAQTNTSVELIREKNLNSDKLDYAMTAVLDFQGPDARLLVKDPLASDQIKLGGHTFPLAADLSIGPAMLLAKARPQRLGFIRMIRPERYSYTARLTRLQPYDPKKIPVIFIHGPTGHGSLSNQQTIDEIHRILLLNLGESRR
jgi:hypothetical protein